MYQTNHPSILFITTDQQRRDTLGCYGNSLIQTPALDRLSAEGVTLDGAYCESPICIPSRITMITGKRSVNHGTTLHNCSMRDSEATLGDALRQTGYDTRFVGKPHFKSQQHRGSPESIADWRDGQYKDWTGPYAGFEKAQIVLGHSNSLTGHYGEWLCREHPHEALLFMDRNLKPLDVSCGQGVYDNRIPEELHSSAWVGRQVCDFLESRNEPDRPFYCFASFPDPHWPVMPPSKYFHMYDDVSLPEETPARDEWNHPEYPQVFRDIKQGRNHYDGGGHYMKNPEDVQLIKRAYWGAVSFIDSQIKKILDTLEKQNLRNNTIVVFTTDHGEYMGCHGMMAKGGVLWDEYIRVPFIISQPGNLPSGVRRNDLFSFTDIVPTLLELTGISAPELQPDGTGQTSMLQGTPGPRRQVLTVHHPSQVPDNPVSGLFGKDELLTRNIVPDQHALIMERYKLVYFAGDSGGLLFDLQDDPCEEHNLYNHPDFADIQATLIRRLMDELILQNHRSPCVHAMGGDCYGKHLMTYEMWKPEFDALESDLG